MAKDSTTCCRRKSEVVKKPVLAKKRPASPLKAPAAKKPPERVFRASTLLGGGTSAPSLASKSQPQRAASSLVCAPDILSMFSDDPPEEMQATAPTPRITISTQPTQRQVRQIGPARVPPLAIRQYVGAQPGTRPQIRPTYMQQQQPSANIPMVQISTSQGTRPVSYQRQTQAASGAPVFHTINGFRIDLNTAAQQDTFRLPNGKLIQVKKQAPQQPPSNAPQQRVIPPISSPQMTQRNIIRGANNGTPYAIQYQQPSLVQFQQQQQQPQPRIINGGQPIQHLQQAYSQPQQQIQSIHQIRPGPPGLPLKPPVCTLQKPCHPPTPLGIARNAFEFKVFNSLEVCHQIIGKINTLSNYPSYKTVNHVSELKDLYTHLSYLLTYAIGRFKSVQDKCNEESKALGLDEEKEKSKDKADDELEVIENQAPIIDLDSEEEGEIPRPTPVKAPSQPQQPVKAPAEPRPSTSSAIPVAAARPAMSISSIIEKIGDPKLKLTPRVEILRAEALIPSVKQLLKKERRDSGATQMQMMVETPDDDVQEQENESDDEPISSLLEVTPDISVMMGGDDDQEAPREGESDDDSVIELTDSPMPLVPLVSMESDTDGEIPAVGSESQNEESSKPEGASMEDDDVVLVPDSDAKDTTSAEQENAVPDTSATETPDKDLQADEVLTVSSQLSTDPLNISSSSQESEKVDEKEKETATDEKDENETEIKESNEDSRDDQKNEEESDLNKPETDNAVPVVETTEPPVTDNDTHSDKGKIYSSSESRRIINVNIFFFNRSRTRTTELGVVHYCCN